MRSAVGVLGFGVGRACYRKGMEMSALWEGDKEESREAGRIKSTRARGAGKGQQIAASGCMCLCTFVDGRILLYCDGARLHQSGRLSPRDSERCQWGGTAYGASVIRVHVAEARAAAAWVMFPMYELTIRHHVRNSV